MSKILTVFGATGQQGGSLLEYLLKRPDILKIYTLRGVTRDPEKDAAVALKQKNVEVVKADMDDKVSLQNAIAGSYAVYAMTNFWEKMSSDAEVAQGKAMADAAVAAGAKLIIWSTLPNVTEMTDGKQKGIKHFDSKAAVEQYIRGLPIKSAFYMPALYMQMSTDMFRPRPNANGDLQFSVSWSEHTSCPMIDVKDTGKYLVPILLDPEKYNGKRFAAATAYYTPAELIDGWKKVTGKEVRYVETKFEVPEGPLPPETIKLLDDTMNGGLMQDYGLFGPTGRSELDWTLKQMDDAPTTWEEFVKANEPWF